MPTLSQTLRQRKNQQQSGGQVRTLGGTLAEESPETIQDLSDKAGLAAPPTTAIGAGILGANPDQQKMQGTPAQKKSALNIAQQPVQNNLQDTLRRQQSRTEMTGEEKAQKEKSQDMQNLGTLGQRVSSFIDAQRNKLAAQAQAAQQGQQQLQVNTADVFNGKDVSSIKQLLTEVRQNPQDQQKMLELNKALGYDINTQLDPTQIDKLYESATDTIARGAAGQVDDDLTVSDLVNSGNLGYSSPQLSQLLGVPESQLQQMTVGQLRAEIDRVGQEEFQKTQELQQKAQSGLLGSSERQLARQAAAEASTTGTRATEADYSNMEQQIQNADVVSFGGKEYKVDELLKDETISGIIRDYLESAPDSQLRKQLEKSEPKLLEFINKNKSVLEDAATQLRAGAGEFRDIQEANKGLSKMGSIELNPEIAAAVIPGYGTLQAARIRPEDVPLLAYSSTQSPERQSAIANALNTEMEKDSSIGSQLAALSQDEIASLGIGKAGSAFDKMTKANDQRRLIENIDPNDTNTLMSMLYGDYSPGKYSQDVRYAKTLSVLGLPTGMDPAAINPQNLKDAALSRSGMTSLKQAANNNIQTLRKGTIGSPNIPSQNTDDGQLFTKLYDVASDGSLSADDLRGPVADKLNLGEAIQLEDKARNGAPIDPAITQLRQQKTDAHTAQTINDRFVGGDPIRSIENLGGLLQEAQRNPRMYNPETIQNKVIGVMQNELENGGTRWRIKDIIGTYKKYGLPMEALQPAIDSYIKKWGSTGASSVMVDDDTLRALGRK